MNSSSKYSGAISTGANSNIILTGGITAASIYFVGATSLTTGVASSFSGTILTGTNVVIAGSLVGKCIFGYVITGASELRR